MGQRRRSVWRGTLRALRLTAVEGVMWRWDANDFVTVEVAGGPPGLVAAVYLDGDHWGTVCLNGFGSGSIALPTSPTHTQIEVVAERLVLLSGHIPASTVQT